MEKRRQFCRRCNVIFSQNFERNMADLRHHINNPIAIGSLITSVISFSLHDRWRAQSELCRSYLEAFIRLL